MVDLRFKYISQIAPWLTLVLLVVMFAFLYNSLAPAPAVAFDLPEGGAADSVDTGLVALLIPADGDGASEGALVFFDDARYVLSEMTGADEFAARLGERAASKKCATLTLLADRRASAGDVMKIMAIARTAGMTRVQLAEKRDQ